MNIAQFHGVPADPEQISHALAIDPKAGMSEADMLRAARSLNLKARAAKVTNKQLEKLPLPIIIGMRQEKFAILAQIINEGAGKSGKSSRQKFLMLMPDGTPPTVLTKAQFERKWTGRVVLFTQ